MVFIGVYRAIYDYAPQAESELEIKEGDLLFVLEKGDDGWWRAKKKAQSEDEEEPEGDIPNNYVEEVSFLCCQNVTFPLYGCYPYSQRPASELGAFHSENPGTK